VSTGFGGGLAPSFATRLVHRNVALVQLDLLDVMRRDKCGDDDGLDLGSSSRSSNLDVVRSAG